MTTLRTVVFMGSAKTAVPPWGGESRLGDRVLKYVQSVLSARAAPLGSSDVKVSHETTIFDPIEVFGSGGALAESGAQLSSPHFFSKPGAAPPAVDASAYAGVEPTTPPSLYP